VKPEETITDGPLFGNLCLGWSRVPCRIFRESVILMSLKKGNVPARQLLRELIESLEAVYASRHDKCLPVASWILKAGPERVKATYCAMFSSRYGRRIRGWYVKYVALGILELAHSMSWKLTTNSG
jgi:hypothetical protein